MTAPRYRPDRRGKHLEDWRLEPSASAWFLEYRGIPATTDHVLGVLPRARKAGTLKHDAEWPYRIRMDFEPDRSLNDFLDFLKEVLVIQIDQQGFVDAAVALDFYRRPVEDGSSETVHTETADLIRQIKKYIPAEQEENNRAGQALCDSLSDVVVRHEWFNEATRILPVPGHTRKKRWVSVMLGTLLSQELGIRLTTVESKSGDRKPTKNMTLEERKALLHDFRIEEDLEGRTVLVLDDIYHTGYTMAGVANAAKRAGAATVLGLAAARNLRR
ncbi:phosphoribosyltransferase [Amycolatopsis sp. NPDC052450]|uniref:phosphoribosyltransferase n=1 Tax=Amycolatopsis sp. NPDC052450 TaxID=3363937 RepID=UPI0037C76DA5